MSLSVFLFVLPVYLSVFSSASLTLRVSLSLFVRLSLCVYLPYFSRHQMQTTRRHPSYTHTTYYNEWRYIINDPADDRASPEVAGPLRTRSANRRCAQLSQPLYSITLDSVPLRRLVLMTFRRLVDRRRFVSCRLQSDERITHGVVVNLVRRNRRSAPTSDWLVYRVTSQRDWDAFFAGARLEHRI